MPFTFSEIANLLKDSVRMDGVSLEEINLMLEMSKGLESDSCSSADLKNKLKSLLEKGSLASAEDICASLQQVFDSGTLSKSALAKTLLVQKVEKYYLVTNFQLSTLLQFNQYLKENIVEKKLYYYLPSWLNNNYSTYCSDLWKLL